MTKEEIREEFNIFSNGEYIEIHSGDLDEIVDMVYEMIKKRFGDMK